MRTLKSRISPVCITSCLHLLNAVPLSPHQRVTSANNRIYANEQLLPVSQTPVFEVWDLMLNNRKLITTCTLPAFIKFPYQLSPSSIMCLWYPTCVPTHHHLLFLPSYSFGVSMDVCLLSMSPLAVMQNLHPLPVYAPLFLYAVKTRQWGRGNWSLSFHSCTASDANYPDTAVNIMKVW